MTTFTEIGKKFLCENYFIIFIDIYCISEMKRYKMFILGLKYSHQMA